VIKALLRGLYTRARWAVAKLSALGAAKEKVSDAASQAARDLGINLSRAMIESGIARLTVGRAETLRPADIRVLASYLEALGATSVVIQAVMENPRLSELITNPRAVRLLLGNSSARATVLGEVTLGHVTERMVEITVELR
jgi:hypothetical protein